MHSATYKQQTSRADAFDRDTLKETIAVLERAEAGLAGRVRSQLEHSAIPKPEQHSGGQESDTFLVELFITEVDSIIEALGVAEVGALGADYSTTREASRFGNLLDTWNRYRFLLHENRAAK